MYYYNINLSLKGSQYFSKFSSLFCVNVLLLQSILKDYRHDCSR